MKTRLASVATLVAMACVGAIGCWAGDDVSRNREPLAARRGSVIVEGCALDSTQSATLAAPATKKVLSEVVLLCLAVHPDGTLSPASTDDRDALLAQVQSLHALGYRVSLATTIGATWDAPAASSDADAFLLNGPATTTAATELSSLVALTTADGLDLAPPALDAYAEGAFTRFVRALRVVRDAGHALEVFAPPSQRSPSDVPGGDAFDLAALSPLVDRVRIMTLDYSCCGAPLGPTIDPGWAVDVARWAAPQIDRKTSIDIAYPLYGWDTPVGAASSAVTYAQAEALAGAAHVGVSRGPTGAPYFDYAGADGTRHEVWFDDATSTLLALHAWGPSTLPADVGVVFYGLGAEDPQLWNAIAEELP